MKKFRTELEKKIKCKMASILGGFAIEIVSTPLTKIEVETQQIASQASITKFYYKS